MTVTTTTILVASQALIWLVLLLFAVALLALARQVGVLFERIAPIGALMTQARPDIGSIAPVIRATSLAGEDITIGGPLSTGTSRILLFVASNCPICKKLIPIAVGFSRDERLQLVFAGDDDEANQRALVARFGIEAYPFLNSAALGRAYGIDKLPQAVLLDDQGRIVARGLVNSREQLESLVVSRDTGVRSIQEFLKSAANHVG